MIMVLIAWVLLSLVLGVVIGKAIHRADVAELSWRPETAGSAARTQAEDVFPWSPVVEATLQPAAAGASWRSDALDRLAPAIATPQH